MTTHWTKVERADYRARKLADHHYSRKHIGAHEFCPPGDNIVLCLLSEDELSAQAFWVSHRPNPYARLSKPRQDGMDYWDNSYFRMERSEDSDLQIPASELIVEALRITRYFWNDPEVEPKDGFHTFIDPKHVAPIRRRGEDFWGYSYIKAGFSIYPQRTKARNLIRLTYSLEQLQTLAPLKPNYEVRPVMLACF